MPYRYSQHQACGCGKLGGRLAATVANMRALFFSHSTTLAVTSSSPWTSISFPKRPALISSSFAVQPAAALVPEKKSLCICRSACPGGRTRNRWRNTDQRVARFVLFDESLITICFTLSPRFGLSERQDGLASFCGSITKSLDADRARPPTFSGSLGLSPHLSTPTRG